MKTLTAVVDEIINKSSYCAMSLAAAERGVNRLVRTEINEYQFSALVSLLISIGTSAFRESQVLKLTNKSQFLLAATHFDDYIEGENEQGTKHLKARRKKERRIYTTPVLKRNNGKTRGLNETA